jgi:Derlin-2/3
MNAKLAPPGSQTSLFGLLSLPVEYLPYAMVVLDLIVGGPSAAAEAVAGVLVGWGWWLVRTSGGADAQRISRAPELLKRFVPEGGEVATAGVQVVPPSGRAGTTSATTSGHSWGSGRRLGR